MNKSEGEGSVHRLPLGFIPRNGWTSVVRMTTRGVSTASLLGFWLCGLKRPLPFPCLW